MKKFLSEFKAFALKGNVLDLAIGVIIGAAFQNIVTSLIDNIINPVIGLLFQTDFSDVVIPMGSVNLGIGAFISSIINFVLMAFVLFCIVKAINKLHDEFEKPKEPVVEEVKKSDELIVLEKIAALLEEKKSAE